MLDNNVLKWVCAASFKNTKQEIISANDLILIMNIGNLWYSSLSQLARQSYLMQKKLPTISNELDTDYELEYSESYTGTFVFRK